MNENVFTIIGCGGNRDAAKRPKMAAIACKYSNYAVFTTDNPRFEDPEEILNQMRKGVPAANIRKSRTVTDRREAINQVVAQAQKGDIILIAGKGHETYQEIRGIRHHFDDKEEVLLAFAKLV